MSVVRKVSPATICRSAVIIRERCIKELEARRTRSMHAATYSGHPAGCPSACASRAIESEKLVEGGIWAATAEAGDRCAICQTSARCAARHDCAARMVERRRHGRPPSASARASKEALSRGLSSGCATARRSGNWRHHRIATPLSTPAEDDEIGFPTCPRSIVAATK